MATVKDRIDALKATAAQLLNTVSSQAVMIATLTDQVEALEDAGSNPTPAQVTIDPIVRRSGQDYIFTLRRDGDPTSPLAYPVKAAASTAYAPGSPESDWPGGYVTATANFAAGSPTTTATITAPVAAQPE